MHKIAFCFLLYDKLEHRKIWEEFFEVSESYNIYSHLKMITQETPPWIKKTRVRSVKQIGVVKV